MSSEHIQRAVPYDMVTARLCFGPPEDQNRVPGSFASVLPTTRLGPREGFFMAFAV